MIRIRQFPFLLAAAVLLFSASTARAQFNETLVECALNEEGSGRAYFFLGDQYVVYDWAADRAVSGTHPISDWGFPATFAPLGFATRLDAALPGKGEYEGFAYFFRHGEYTRFRFSGPRGLDPSYARPLSVWELPGGFNLRVDAAFNGKLNRSRYAYFFQGSQVVRYDWIADRADSGPNPIATNMPGMPAHFAAGLDAAIDGDGAYADFGYLFKGDQYARMNWVSSGDPRVDPAGARRIHENWPGLAELLLAGKAKSQSLGWLWTARAQLAAYIANLDLGTPYPFNASLMQQALATHFHIAPGQSAAQKSAQAKQVLATFASVEGIYHQSTTRLRYRNDTEAEADGRWDAASATPDTAAYASFQGKISLTRLFPTYGPLCRAAQFLHETVHVVDNQSGSATTHIPEWYVTEPEATRLGLTFAGDHPDLAQRYDAMPFSDAVHNPSSYAAFAQHLFYGSDTRYGAGKPLQ